MPLLCLTIDLELERDGRRGWWLARAASSLARARICAPAFGLSSLSWVSAFSAVGFSWFFQSGFDQASTKSKHTQGWARKKGRLIYTEYIVRSDTAWADTMESPWFALSWKCTFWLVQHLTDCWGATLSRAGSECSRQVVAGFLLASAANTVLGLFPPTELAIR
jgi:hypothetical protein